MRTGEKQEDTVFKLWKCTGYTDVWIWECLWVQVPTCEGRLFLVWSNWLQEINSKASLYHVVSSSRVITVAASCISHNRIWYILLRLHHPWFNQRYCSECALQPFFWEVGVAKRFVGGKLWTRVAASSCWKHFGSPERHPIGGWQKYVPDTTLFVPCLTWFSNHANMPAAAATIQVPTEYGFFIWKNIAFQYHSARCLFALLIVLTPLMKLAGTHHCHTMVH